MRVNSARGLKLALILLCLAAGAFGFRRQTSPPDLSSPKATVRSFVAAVAQRDWQKASACVAGGKSVEGINDLLPKAFSTLEAKDFVAEVEGDKARVAVELSTTLPPTPGIQLSTLTLMDILSLQRSGDSWQIVPDSTALDSFQNRRIETHPLRLFVALLNASEETVKQVRAQALTTACLSNGKQIGLGLLMYCQDYDEIFPRRKASYKDLIFPYIKSDKVFTCPLDTPGTLSYRINPNLQGATLASIVAPAQTVLLYEGKGDRPDFRHDGRAVIIFADGHARLTSEAQMGDCFWYPAGARPAPPTSKAGIKARPQKRGH